MYINEIGYQFVQTRGALVSKLTVVSGDILWAYYFPPGEEQ